MRQAIEFLIMMAEAMVIHLIIQPIEPVDPTNPMTYRISVDINV
jgi:hypothetical protein